MENFINSGNYTDTDINNFMNYYHYDISKKSIYVNKSRFLKNLKEKKMTTMVKSFACFMYAYDNGIIEIAPPPQESESESESESEEEEESESEKEESEEEESEEEVEEEEVEEEEDNFILVESGDERLEDNDYEDYMNLKKLYEYYMETYGHADNDLESVVRRPIIFDAHIIIGEMRMLKKKFEEDLENIVYNKNV